MRGREQILATGKGALAGLLAGAVAIGAAELVAGLIGRAGSVGLHRLASRACSISPIRGS